MASVLDTAMKVTSVHRPEHAVLVAMLRQMRLDADLTQAAVAEKLGVAQTAISDIETNVRGVDFLLVRDLCQIYKVEMEDFLPEFEKQLLKKKLPKTKLLRKDKRL